MRKCFSAISALAFAALATPVQAQDALAALDASTVRIYAKALGEALPSLMTASAKLEEARGNKVKADEYRAFAAEAISNASKTDAKVAEKLFAKASESADSTAAAFTGKAAAQTKEQRALFVEGVIEYFKGTKATQELSNELPALSKAMADAKGIKNPLQLRKVASLMGVASALTSGIPSVGKANVTTAVALKNYISANNIPMPGKLSYDTP